MTAAQPSLRGRFVGRDHQLEHLEASLAEAREGRLRAVLVLGEAGFGKTRLTSEFVARHRATVLALSARAYPLGATASLGLWVEALERALRAFTPGEVAELCGGHLEDLASLLPSARAAWEGPAPVEPPRIRLLAALAALLEQLSRRGAVAITLDDVHLADGSSWEALNYLARNLVDSPFLVLLVARPTELAGHGVAGEVVRALEQEGLLTRLAVGPLSPDEVRDVAAGLARQPVPDALVEWLSERAEGSPLFVTGLVRALLDEGADLAHPSLRSLPENLAERVEARLRALDSASKAVLELLAVIGYRAELSDLLRLTGQSLDDVAAILERLVAVRLVDELEAGRELVYEVAHPLIQEAVYGQIGGARRRALHRHAARVLVEAGQYGAAASHVVKAADPGDEEAVQTLCEALRRAGAGGHHREALALLDALLEMLPAGDRRWLRVLEVMPLTPDWVVDHRADTNADVGVRAMRRADQVLERAAGAAHRAAVKFSLGSLLAWGMCELEQGRELVAEARDLFAASGDEPSALVASNELGYHAAFADDVAAHERIAREVLASAEARADPGLLVHALSSLGWALNLTGRLEESLPVVERGVEQARAAGRTYRVCYLTAMRASTEHLLGRGHGRAEIDACKEAHPAYRDTLLLDFAAQIAWAEGDLNAVVAACLDQMAWDGGLSTRRAFGASMAVMALAEMGRHEEAASIHRTAQAPFRGRSCWVLSRLVDWSGAVAAWLGGDQTGGLERLAAVCDDATGHGYWGWGRWMAVDLAEACAYAAGGVPATSAAAVLQRDPCPPAGPSHDGARAFVGGDFDAAAGAFAGAGWRLLEGRALALHGSALAREDRARAAQAFEAAIDRFDACGAAVRRDRALAALGALGPRGRRKSAQLGGPGALSGREREVAALAARGCSAREIAEQLFIGERTVETHLANAYAKLGVASKVDLVRRAAELGF
ncbi:MAG TPA: AAA family ATPase [Acidimicrobiales bacterium]|nr:AAA family ATPase [Acidimicrobiales bacterium]